MTSIGSLIDTPRSTATHVRLAGLDFDRLAEAEVVQHIIEKLQSGQGGWVATPNVDICRQIRHKPAIRTILRNAALIVPDGMPLLWAARLRGDRLAERVTGSSLIFSLTSAAARNSRSIYLLGGEAGVPELAGEELARRYPGLRVAGAAAPHISLGETPDELAAVRESLLLATPDIVYVGLGFPKQERLITQLAASLPSAWFIACGAAISFAAGALPRAPSWMQRSGLEWIFRLCSEPRRLFRRYLIHDPPYAAQLLASSALVRIRAHLPWITRMRSPVWPGHHRPVTPQPADPRIPRAANISADTVTAQDSSSVDDT